MKLFCRIFTLESDFGFRAYPPLSNICTTPKNRYLIFDIVLKIYLDEETGTPTELLPKEHWRAYKSDKELEQKLCKATQDAQNRERKSAYNEPRFLRSSEIHRFKTIRESSVKINIARKRQPNKRSQKNLDGLYETLAPDP